MKNNAGRIPLFRQPLMAIHRQYKKTEIQKHQLQYIMWECTLQCNFHCLHCGSDCKKDSRKPQMPVEDFLRCIDDITPIVHPQHTTVVITGGEPLMRSDIEQAGKELYNRKFPWGMVTNGFLLTDDRLKGLIDSGMHTISISLDGFERTHDWLRGVNGSFHKAVQAIARVAASGIIFDVVTCVHQRNFSELDALHNLLSDLGVKRWRIFTIFPLGRATSHSELMLSNIEFRELFEKIKTWRAHGIMHVNYGCEGFLGKYEGEVRDNFFFCRAGINIASILADGSVTGCNNINSRYIQGNIYHDSFAEIWEKRFKPMRNRNWMRTGECETCKHFHNCRGNGFHLRNERGELLLCHLKKLNNTTDA